MSRSSAKPVALAVVTALGGIALSGSAFSMTQLAAGYMVASTANEAKAGEGSCGMSRADGDGDGRISAAEFATAHPEKDPSYFATMDVNGDGFVDQAEHDAHHAARKAGSEGKAADKSAEEGKCGEGKCGGAGACGGTA